MTIVQLQNRDDFLTYLPGSYVKTIESTRYNLISNTAIPPKLRKFNPKFCGYSQPWGEYLLQDCNFTPLSRSRGTMKINTLNHHEIKFQKLLP